MTLDLEVTYTIRTRAGLSATRLLADGRVQERSGARRWRKLTVLSPEARDELAGVVERTGFFGWPAQMPTAVDIADGTLLTWEVRVGTRRHQVAMRHGGGPIAEPGFAALDEALQRLIGDALDAESEPGG